jgi:CheY-like chemotaxis protein
MAYVLVVDDDVDVGDLLADLLREEGHDVQVARNGREGVTLLRAKRPDLVLLDVEMPVLTGPEMAYEMLLHDLGWEESQSFCCPAS